MSSVRVALRLARRDAWRSKGRSALVVAMIAIPVLGVSASDVLYRSFQLSEDQKATRRMGTADAILSDSGQVRVRQFPTIDGVAWDGVVPEDSQPRTGPVPPGKYGLFAVFGETEGRVGEITLAAGETRTIKCQRKMRVCR